MVILTSYSPKRWHHRTQSKICAWLHIIKVNVYQGSPCFCYGLTVMTYIRRALWVCLIYFLLMSVWFISDACQFHYILSFGALTGFSGVSSTVLFAITLSWGSCSFMVCKQALILKGEQFGGHFPFGVVLCSAGRLF